MKNTSKKQSVSKKQAQSSSAGLVILQWLTYAFWGWTLLALVWLLYIILATYIENVNTSDYVPYAVASILVLLPISLVCDIFYGRKEPQKKTGVAMVVMVIHAVIFALFAIGALISAVLFVVQTMISTPVDPDSRTVWIATFLISAALYAFTFVRTLNPSPKLKITLLYPLVMGVIVTFLIVLGFMGPVSKAAQAKNDNDIVRYLPDVSNMIQAYVRDEGKLPKTLGDVDFEGGAKMIVDKGLVEYKNEGSSFVSKLLNYPSMANEDDEYTDTFYRYQLCVDYDQKKGDMTAYRDMKYSEGEYQMDLFIYDHPAGDVCYKLEYVVNGWTSHLEKKQAE